LKLLCTADLHLGRSVPLPEDVSQEAHGPSRAWRLICDIAVDERVDALLIAGDSIDSEKSYAEGMAVFRHGLRRLQAAGVPVVLTAGNHDWNLLAEASMGFPGVVPLGLSGRWETHSLGDVTIAGWSFPGRHHRESPMTGFPENLPEKTVGLLHCDLASPGSLYAPVRAGDLESRPVAKWILGHMHSPQDMDRLFYPGSPLGLNAGETGPRSVVMLDTDVMCCRRIPLAVLEWKLVSITEDDLLDPEERISSAVERVLGAEAGSVLTGFRVLFQGRTARSRDFRKAAASLDNAGFPGFFIQQAIDETKPLLDIPALAKGRKMSSLLAAEVQNMDPRSEDYSVGADLLEELLERERGLED
jgi:DNA repair exonuclease SbcCD nuclease subunit